LGAERKSILGDWMSVHSHLRRLTLPLPHESVHLQQKTARQKVVNIFAANAIEDISPLSQV
jgi:hypothetical protein